MPSRLSVRTCLFSLILPLGMTLGSAGASASVGPTASVSEGEDGAARSSEGQEKAGKNKTKKKGQKKGQKKAKKKAGKKARKRAKKGAKRGKHGAAVCGPLACTDAQREQVALMTARVRQAQKKNRDAGRALQTSLAREVAKASPSKKELARVRNELATHRNAADDRMFDALIELHSILDADQRRRLSSMIEEHGVRRVILGGGGRGERRGKGPQKKGRGKEAADGRQGPQGPPARTFVE